MTFVKRGVEAKEQSILEQVVNRLEEEINDTARYVKEGKCKTFDEYSKKVGRIQGLQLAWTVIKDTKKRYLEE